MGFKQNKTIGVVIGPLEDAVVVIPDTEGRIIYEQFDSTGKSSENSKFFEVLTAETAPISADETGIVVNLNDAEQVKAMVVPET